MTRVLVFMIIFVGATWFVEESQLPYQDEVWLISGLIASFVLYWIRPIPTETYLRFTGPILILVLGAYLIVLKVPKLLTGVVNHKLSGPLCLAIYGICCWIVIKADVLKLIAPAQPRGK